MRSAGVCSYLVLSGLPEASGRWVCRNFRSELEAPLLRLSLPGCRLSPRCFMRALHSDRWHAADLDACAGRSGGSAGLPTCFAVLPWTCRAQSSARASGARLTDSGAFSAQCQLSGVPGLWGHASQVPEPSLQGASCLVFRPVRLAATTA